MKKCPFCAEEIQDEAIKCRYCFEFLDGRPSPGMVVEANKLPWYLSTSFLILSFVTLPPVVLPLIWFHPRLHWVMKLLISVVVVAVTWLCVVSLIRFVHMFDDVTKMWETGGF